MSRLERVGNWEALAAEARYRASALAKLCQVSPSQLRRYFKETFHSSPQEWLNRLRLEEAARLLLQPELPVKDIAWRCGFADTSHLSHAFHRHFGCSPSDFAAAKRSDKLPARPNP